MESTSTNHEPNSSRIADEQHWTKYEQLKKANKQQHEVIVVLKGKLKVQ